MEYAMIEDLRWMIRRDGDISKSNKNILVTKKQKEMFDERKETNHKIYDSLGRLIEYENKVYVRGSDDIVDYVFKTTTSFTSIFGFIERYTNSEYDSDNKLLWQRINEFEYKIDAKDNILIVSEIETHNRYTYKLSDEPNIRRDIVRFETIIYLNERKVIKKDYKTGKEIMMQKYDEFGNIIYSKSIGDGTETEINVEIL